MEGEIYKFGQGIFISSDYGESFQFFAENPYYFICDLGIEPGQLWAKENLGGNNIDLYRMDDYSGQFEKIARVDSSLCFSTLNYFYRGANPGELYYYQAVQTIGTGVGYYSIHFSSDNGENFELRYQSETFCWGCIDIRMVSGRDEGTFYVCRKAPDYHLGAWVLEISNYSSDTAKTFETYTHILDETVMQKEIKPPAPVISLYPNPFQQNTSIYLSLNKQENVSISVYSLNGRLVKHLLEGKLLSGKNEIEWNGKDALGNEVKNGLYFVKVKTGKASKSFKIIKK
ncbi:MAG: T9SS type A sorting domain-containing protein [Bacteroidota bacterium]|nr:T9SS type A sorting domain-containing protein [Bacteroidota bacterium]